MGSLLGRVVLGGEGLFSHKILCDYILCYSFIYWELIEWCIFAFF